MWLIPKFAGFVLTIKNKIKKELSILLRFYVFGSRVKTVAVMGDGGG